MLVQGGFDTGNPAIGEQDFVNNGLADLKIFLILQYPLHSQPVEEPVCLGTGGADCRTLTGIQPAELDTGGINILCHFPAQGINFLNQMPLGKAANGRVAGHGTNGVCIYNTDQSFAAHPGCCQGCLATGVACSYYCYIKISHGLLFIFIGKQAQNPADLSDKESRILSRAS
jgi:hypothetical protein